MAPVALVTGASRGVGAAVARHLASLGYVVGCAARSTRSTPRRTPGTLDDVVTAINRDGGQAFAVPTDLSVAEEVDAMVAATVDRAGRLDVLVNNAAITFLGDVDIEWRRHRLIMAVNLDAPFLALRAAVPHLRAAGRGRVLNVSSVAALYPYRGMLSYGMSKAALERLTVGSAQELASDSIAVNCFRIDVPVASEGFVANTPGLDRRDWEPCDVAAEGIAWMLGRPTTYSGRLEGMRSLARRAGIMRSRSAVPYLGPEPPTAPAQGLQRDLGGPVELIDG